MNTEMSLQLEVFTVLSKTKFAEIYPGVQFWEKKLSLCPKMHFEKHSQPRCVIFLPPTLVFLYEKHTAGRIYGALCLFWKNNCLPNHAY